MRFLVIAGVIAVAATVWGTISARGQDVSYPTPPGLEGGAKSATTEDILSMDID